MSRETNHPAAGKGNGVDTNSQAGSQMSGRSTSTLPRPNLRDFDPMDILDATISGQFERFHARNPHVYAHLVRAARKYREQTGHTRCGIDLLFGRVRWVLAVETDEADPRLNNNFKPFYARMIMDREPDLAGMFALRSATADKHMQGAFR